MPVDPKEAVRWYRKAARRGDSCAQYSLGVMLGRGSGVARDDAKMMTWWRMAAGQGDANAQYALGWMYDQCGHAATDSNAALGWYKMAADQGHASAQYALGNLYARGEQVAQDDVLAAELLSSAAAQGNASAMLWLGWLYAHGRGLPYDPLQSYVWANLAVFRLPSSAIESRDLAIEYRDWAGSCLNSRQVGKARRLIKKWAPISTPAVAPMNPGLSSGRASGAQTLH